MPGTLAYIGSNFGAVQKKNLNQTQISEIMAKPRYLLPHQTNLDQWDCLAISLLILSTVCPRGLPLNTRQLAEPRSGAMDH